jgi:hypothetical protein
MGMKNGTKGEFNAQYVCQSDVFDKCIAISHRLRADQSRLQMNTDILNML